MVEDRSLTRRSALAIMAASAGALVASGAEKEGPTMPDSTQGKLRLNGRVHHSVCRWCYSKMPLDDLCREAAAMGLESVELLKEDEWPAVKKYGLTCAMPMGPSGIADGWNRLEDHDRLVKESERLLPLIAENGFPNMIVFSGNRRGISDAQGLDNCARGLSRITPTAEKLGITMCMELLNSKRDHKDYQCDRTPWGVELAKKIGSDRFKLLYDIYHMQIMEGDVIATIRENIQYLHHFHTGGVPGRNEIDDTQELNYRRIAEAIMETGFKGYIAQEFIPKRDPMTSLRQGITICDV
ncbi:MAG: TIM barrel protein [Candidatus Hydrogenedentes bacterium]|nr:TIM barrel protein [Candidatus Hydrogenedentota bacterium]